MRDDSIRDHALHSALAFLRSKFPADLGVDGFDQEQALVPVIRAAGPAPAMVRHRDGNCLLRRPTSCPVSRRTRANAAGTDLSVTGVLLFCNPSDSGPNTRDLLNVLATVS